MAKYTDYKLVANGHVLELYRYEKGCYYDYEGQGGRKKREQAEDRNDEYRRQSRTRARNEVRRQVLANFSEHSKFLTLTFRDGSVDDVTNVKQCNYAFKKFIGRLKYQMKKRDPSFKLKYIAVIEFQDKNNRGAVHYHMISNLPYIKNNHMRKIWGNGIVKINDIKHVDNVGAYMVKYMLKDMDDARLDGEKAYLSSQGLIKSSVIRGNIVLDILENYGIDLESTKRVFESSYTSEHHGQINYLEFNLKRL